MEHHSNIVPWQIIANELGLIIDYIPINSDYELDLVDIDKYFCSKTKICLSLLFLDRRCLRFKWTTMGWSPCGARSWRTKYSAVFFGVPLSGQ